MFEDVLVSLFRLQTSRSILYMILDQMINLSLSDINVLEICAKPREVCEVEVSPGIGQKAVLNTGEVLYWHDLKCESFKLFSS
jgi:hypothetical protein